MREHREIHAPYVGLRPFEPHEMPIFFGREANVSRLLQILQRERFLAIIGTSGSGKSSLVRAGMLPALSVGWTGDVSDWRIAIMRPGDRPLRRLAEALLDPEGLAYELEGAATAPDDTRGNDASSPGASALPLVEAELWRGPRSLIDLVADAQRHAPERKFNLLVLVDQFEEIFRYAGAGADQANESEAFVNAILEPRLLDSEAARRIYVALTMRTDALHECAHFLELPEAINRAQYLVPRLSPDDLGRAIIEPARVFEGRVSPEIATQLVNSVIHAQDQLPILQHALARMWETASRRDARHPVIDESDVAQTGGIENALSNHANSLFEQLSPIEQMYAEVLFRAITDTPERGTTDARRPQRLGDIARFADRKPDEWDVFVPVLRAFASEGVNFLAFSEPLDAGTVIDISHEALIRQWDRLRGWVADEAQKAAVYRRWRNRSDDYWKRGAELLSGADLAAAVQWRGGASIVNETLRKFSAVGRRAPLGQPTANWAMRYSSGRTPAEAAAEFERVLTFISLSEKNEAERVEAVRRAEEERRAEKERAAALELQAQRERADAAAREQALAQKGERTFRRVAWLAGVIAVLAVSAAAAATYFWWSAKASFQSATAVRAAAQGQAMVAGVHPGGTLRGVLQLLAAHRIERGVEPYAAMQSATKQLARVVRLIDAPQTTLQVVFSPDGKRILSRHTDYVVRLWNAQTGAPLGELPPGQTKYASSAAFSPDGKRLVLGSYDNTLRLWDAEKLVPIGEPFSGHSNQVLSVAFSPDSRRIVSGSEDKTLRVWDAEKGIALGDPLIGHTDSVRSVAFSPDGKRIASGSSDKTVRLWDAGKSLPIGKPLLGHTDSIWSVAFSSDGTRIVSGGYDATLRLWDAERGIAVGEPLRGHTGSVATVAFSPGRSKPKIASAGQDGTVRLWDADTGAALGEPLRGHAAWITSVAFSPEGSRIVSASSDGVRIWDAAADTPTEQPPVDTSRGFEYMLVSPDGRRIASHTRRETLRFWDAEQGTALGEALRAHERSLIALAFSPDGKRAASGGLDGTLRLWNAENGTALSGPLPAHRDPLSALAFSPDGKRIVSGSWDGTLRLWGAERGTAIGEPMRGHAGFVMSVAFSRDGKRIVSGSADKTLRLWNADKGVAIGEPLQGHTLDVNSVAFSPDGKRIVSGGSDTTIRLWDAERGVPLSEALHGHRASVLNVAFSGDGRHIVSFSINAIRLWDAKNGVPLGEPLGATSSWFSNVFFAEDGKHVVAATDRHTLRAWPVLDAWAEALCEKVPRNMTPQEWDRWIGAVPYACQCPALPCPGKQQ
jgi:WD40 repeat protein